MSRKKQPRIPVESKELDFFESPTPKQKVQRYLNSVEERVISNIDSQSLKIPRQKTPYLIKEPKRQFSAKQLKAIRQKKEQMENKLDEIVEKQKQYQAKYSRQKTINLSPFRPKSQLTHEDISKLKQLKHNYSSFEKELEEKTKAFEEKEKKIAAEERELMEKRKQQESQKRKELITKRLEEMEDKRNEREKKFQQEKQLLKKLKIQKKIHEELKARQEREEQEYFEMKKQRMQKRFIERTIDLTTLKEHERKYEEFRKKHKRELSRRRGQLSKLAANEFINEKPQKSKYYTIIQEETRKYKEDLENERENPSKKLKKMREYSQNVSKNHPPHVKPHHNSDDQLEIYEKKSQISRLQPEQAKMLGLHFLQVSKLRARKGAKQEVSVENPEQKKYPNYLNDVKKHLQRQKQGEEKDYRYEINEVKKIMKKKDYNQKQKFQRVKIMTDKIEQDSKLVKSSGLVKKIAAKIEIIETIY